MPHRSIALWEQRVWCDSKRQMRCHLVSPLFWWSEKHRPVVPPYPNANSFVMRNNSENRYLVPVMARLHKRPRTYIQFETIHADATTNLNAMPIHTRLSGFGFGWSLPADIVLLHRCYIYGYKTCIPKRRMHGTSQENHPHHHHHVQCIACSWRYTYNQDIGHGWWGWHHIVL